MAAPRRRRALDAAALGDKERSASSARRTVCVGIVHALQAGRERRGATRCRARRRRSSRARRSSRTGSRTGRRSRAAPLAPAAMAGSACSGATVRPGWSPPRRRTSTRSSCSPAPSWRGSAGAHSDEKGAGLCHGTSGNGYALLKTFERTGDERWLERARRFAVHALAQARGSARPVLAVHRRCRCRPLRSGVPRGGSAVPGARRLGLTSRGWHGRGESCSARRTRARSRRTAAGCSRGCATRSGAAAAR